MNFLLQNYNLGYKVVSFAKDESVQNELLENELNVIRLAEDKIVLLPDNIDLEIMNGTFPNFSSIHNFDVFEINEKGQAYQFYNDASTDNTFVITSRCNSNCVMCPIPEEGRKFAPCYPKDDLIELARYVPSDTRHLTITGGEPFLMGKDIFEFLSFLRDKFERTDFLILTNGRVFCLPEYCELLEDSLPESVKFGIPIHGYNSETHDKITQAKGSFEQTLVGVKNLLSMNMSIELRIVVSKLNADFIDEIAELICTEFPTVACVKVMGLEMLGNAAKNMDRVWLTYDEAFRKSKSAIKRMIYSGIDVGLYNFPLCSVDQEFWTICEKSITDYKVRFPDKCEECIVKDACGGIFAGTMRLAGNSVVPVKEIKDVKLL